MEISVAFTNRRKADAPYPYVPDILSLARDSDFLVVAVSAGPDARHLVSREVIEALGAGEVLINMARGSIVDEEALAEALQIGKLGGAGLDVFECEPHVTDALLGLDSVILTLHIGSSTMETRMDMGDLVINNLSAYFAGRPLVSEVPESAAIRAAWI